MALYRILGTLTVSTGDRWTQVSAAKQRALLALLLIRHGEVLGTDLLVEQLWPQQRPRTARELVYGYVARLRKLLPGGQGSLLAHRGAGYRLVVDPDDIDAVRFERALAAAEQAMAGRQFSRARTLALEALGLWRGRTALADVASCVTMGAAEADRLVDRRFAARHVLALARLHLGEQTNALAELDGLVAERPFDEELQRLRILHLYRMGRAAEALAACRRARAVLGAELGIEPGPGLREVEVAILRHDPQLLRSAGIGPRAAPVDGGPTRPAGAGAPGVPGPRRPSTATSRAPRLIGRYAELARMSAALEEAREAGGRPVLLVTGAPGVGKTALAVQWAHRVAALFPDGQLFVDLKGHAAGGALHPHRALGLLLQALGAAAIPARLDEAVETYRSLLADRRVLVLLDDAAGAEQVGPLLPAGPGSAAVVTSRGQLTDLVTGARAHPISTDVLSLADAVALLRDALGDTGPVSRAVPTGPIAALAEACGRLPLALRVAASGLTQRGAGAVTDLVAQLHRSALHGTPTSPQDKDTAPFVNGLAG